MYEASVDILRVDPEHATETCETPTRSKGIHSRRLAPDPI
jgi:hypothetical protein